MALLPNFGQRHNDIEISSGAPITEGLMRKLGSNINLLLDFLGITDGTTSAAGNLSDLTQAIDFVETNGYDLLGSVTAAQTPGISVGTVTLPKFVNAYIMYHMPSSIPSVVDFVNDGISAFTMPPAQAGMATSLRIDGGSWFAVHNPPTIGTDLNTPVYDSAFPGGAKFVATRGVSLIRLSSPQASGSTFYEVGGAYPSCLLDYRDGSSFEVAFGTQSFAPLDIYVGYYLNVGSSDFTF